MPRDLPSLELPPEVIKDRTVPPVEVLDDLRARGPVSAEIADTYLDPKLGQVELDRAVSRIKTDALADAAVAASDRSGRVDVDIDGAAPAAVDSIAVDGFGALVCTVAHPDLPDVYPPDHPAAGVEVNPFRFVNPPVMVPDGTTSTMTVEVDGKPVEVEVPNLVEDPEAAFRVAVSRAVKGALEPVE